MAEAKLGLLSACVVVAAACSGSPAVDAGFDAGLTMTPVEMCERLASARCDLMTRCYVAFAREASADCRQYEQARCLDGYQALRSSFEANKVEINAGAVLRCETRLLQSSCAATFPPRHPAGMLSPFADCELETGLLKGKVASGETCDQAVECAPGSVCVKPGDVCRGTCSLAPNVGEPCAFGCAAGTWCDDHGTPNDTADDRCVARKGLNETCKNSSECADEWVCENTCRPRGKLGEACVLDTFRLSTCEPGLACDVTPFVDGASGKCVAPGDLGTPCQFHFACKTGLVCARNWTGFPMMVPEMGFCSTPQPLDGACVATVYSLYLGDLCAAGTYCSNTDDACKAAPKQGETCQPSVQNCAGVGIYCKPLGGDQGVCTGPVSQGERCAFDVDATRQITIPCASGYCDKQTTLTCRAAHKALGEICESAGECLSNRCAVQPDRTLRCANPC